MSPFRARLVPSGAGAFTVAIVSAIVLLASSAGALTMTGPKLAAGQASVASCGSLAAMTVRYSVVNGSIVSAALTTIPAGCNGGQISLTLANGLAGLSAGGPVAIAAGAATVTISPATPIGQPTKLASVVVGP